MEKKSALKLRNSAKRRKPKFKRQEGWKHAKLTDSWRRPKGRHSKLRQKEKSRGRHPGPGYGSPKHVRGLTRSGLQEARVSNPSQLEGLDPKSRAVMIAGSVGKAKKEAIREQARKSGLKVLN
jgi:large subunit ribosomal protein L32e